MRSAPGLTLGLSLLALLGATVGTAGAGDEGSQLSELKYKSIEKWPFVLPNETWSNVRSAIDLEGGYSFVTEKTGIAKLEIDTNDDGKLDQKVKGVKGFLTLTSKDRDGDKYKYSIRLRNTGRAWQWTSSGVMTGKVRGTQVQLVDQNGNGRFDDIGKDAILIGRDKAASYLCKTVNLGGQLFDIEVNEDGSQIESTPYVGETARIEVHDEWEGAGGLTAAIFNSKDKQVSFNAAAAKKGGLLVPAGEYRLASGYAEKGSESARIRGGRMPAVELAANTTETIKWGGPVTMEFNARQRDDKVTVSADVKFFGNAGEEYHSFHPDTKSPKILIRDKSNRKLLLSGRFGSC